MKTVLVTGANRGIGRGLVETLAARPSYTVIAAVRDPTSANAVSLNDVAVGEGSKLIVVKIEGTTRSDPFEAVKQIEAQGIAVVDVVIANAGIGGAYARIDEINIDDTRRLLESNTLPVISLFQAFLPLLRKSSGPQLVAISSNAASIVDMEENITYLLGSYGVSKAALNFLVRRIHFENEWLTAYSVHPGFTKTDMGNAGARSRGLAEAHLSIDESVNGILRWVDKAKRETESGNFYRYDGSEMIY